MTPLKAGCPASSELLRSSSRSQGIPGGGVNDGAIWPFFSALNAERYTLNAGMRGLFCHARGRSRGVRCCLGKYFVIALSPGLAERVSMSPKYLQEHPF